MHALFVIISVIGLLSGIVLIIALLVNHQDTKLIDAKYQATYKTTKALIDSMNWTEEKH